MSRFRIYLVLFFMLLLHMTILDKFRILGCRPDLVLATVIFYAIFFGGRMGMETGIVAGFLTDIFALDLFGINVFIFCVVGLSVGAMNTKFFKESRVIQFLLVFFFTLLANLAHILLLNIFIKFASVTFFGYLMRSALPASLYTAMISIPLFMGYLNIFGLKKDEELL